MSLFGAYIKHMRTEKGLTLRSIAEAVGVDPSSLSRLERGEVANPSDELLSKLADTLGRSTAEVYLAAGRITPGLATKMEQAMPIGLFQTAKVLDKLELEMRDTLEPVGDRALSESMSPENLATLEKANEAMYHLSEIVDAVASGKVSHSQFAHVAENIKQLKLAILNRDNNEKKP